MVSRGPQVLADRLGWIDFSQFSTNTWVYLFGAAGLVFLVAAPVAAATATPIGP